MKRDKVRAALIGYVKSELLKAKVIARSRPYQRNKENPLQQLKSVLERLHAVIDLLERDHQDVFAEEKQIKRLFRQLAPLLHRKVYSDLIRQPKTGKARTRASLRISAQRLKITRSESRKIKAITRRLTPIGTGLTRLLSSTRSVPDPETILKRSIARAERSWESAKTKKKITDFKKVAIRAKHIQYQLEALGLQNKSAHADLYRKLVPFNNLLRGLADLRLTELFFERDEANAQPRLSALKILRKKIKKTRPEIFVRGDQLFAPTK